MENEPKFIVFCSMLLQIFSFFCFHCKSEGPAIEMFKNGTMVTVIQSCKKCGRCYKWRSQPLTLGKHPAGNILVSFGSLVAGASISKTILIFKHIGISIYNIRTYFHHQRKFLFPTILKHWQAYQDKLIEEAKAQKDLTWSGDGRFDSMGHSAKYCVYSMFSPSMMKIVHFELLQVFTFIMFTVRCHKH